MNNKYSILVVDDEEIIRTAIGYDLKSKGYNVSLAESGEEAIEVFLEKQSDNAAFDLVLTDVLMGGIDGIEVLRRVKEENAMTMVIVLTGHGDLQSAINSVKLDADDYLLKPCKPEELEFTIKQCFQKLELQKKVKLYEKLLPVCCMCNNIRDDSGTEIGNGRWMGISDYLHVKTNVEVSHTYCPDCFKLAKAEISEQIGRKME